MRIRNAAEEAETTCELEKLHLSGAIQGFGALVCFDEATGTVTHCSANISEIVGQPLITAQGLLGTSIFATGWVTPAQTQQLSPEVNSTFMLSRTLLSNSLSAMLIRSTSGIVLEMESHAEKTAPIALHQLQGLFLEVPDSEDDVRASQQALLKAIQRITDFDRVMMYKFHEDWSGEVVAEQTVFGASPYLGLHFPASDIPAIARHLYVINPSRLIPDTAAAAVSILSRSTVPPDLTRSDLRSVSPQHLQYLANMGVRASFSVPLLVGNALWGLIACHSMEPRHVRIDQRLACIALARAQTLGATSYLASRRVQLIDSLGRDVDKVLKSLFATDDPLSHIDGQSDRLMAWLSAQGFAIAIHDDVVLTGVCPDFEAMSMVDDWFVVDQDKSTVHSDHLVDIFGESASTEALLAAVSGLFAIKGFSSRWGWIRLYWFRQEVLREVSWAGEPVKVMAGNAGQEILSPRKSFEKWVEKKSGYSRPWTTEDLLVSAKFRSALSKWL